MYYKYKKVKNPVQSTFNDVKLFEQNSYCYNYLKKRFPDKTAEELKEHSEISSSCFRQASEYYNAASSVSISTSPLLYSYALNNLLKGVCYLITFDEKILNGFKAHGFKVDSDYLIGNDIINSKVTVMKQEGAVHSLLRIYDNFLNKQEIPIFKILRHIPDLDDIYFRTIGSISFIAKDKQDGENEFFVFGNQIDEETSNIFKEFHLMGNVNSRCEECYFYTTMASQKLFEDKIISKKNVYYKSYMNIPDMFDEGLKDVNVSFYCYLLIMSYGMIVRYNANIWEKYIDKKNSSFSTLIELSIPNAVINFYYQMHFLLFDFYYLDESYSTSDVKRIIKDSTVDIMNNITNKISRDSIQYGRDAYLPWNKNIR